MNPRLLTTSLIGACLVFALVLVGCLQHDDGANPAALSLAADAATRANPGAAGRAEVRFAVQVSPGNAVGPFAAAVRPSKAASPTVSVCLTSIFVGNTLSPTIAATHTATVDSNGRADLAISTPAVPTVAQVKITAGAIGTYTDFRGALDLALGPNTIVVQPVSTGMTQDVAAQTILTLVASPTAFAKAPRTLAANVLQIITTANRSGDINTVYASSAAAVAGAWAATNTGTNAGTGTGTGAGAAPSVDLGGGVTMNFATLPAGTFTMGSPDNEPNRESNEGPQHQVTISRALVVQTTEVTQAQWLRVMGSWPGTAPSSRYGVGDTYPAYGINWPDAVRFCNTLSTRRGLTPCYAHADGSTTIYDNGSITCDLTKTGYRLPTEAEWEYACRANTTTTFYWGSSLDGAYCWLPSVSNQSTNPVGTKLPNGWGLYDMNGNVWEWCWDWYGSYSAGAAVDPTGTMHESFRILRGGSFNNFDMDLRSANREYQTPQYRENFVGFRVVRSASGI